MPITDSIELQYQRGNLLRSRGEIAEAERIMREILKRLPNHSGAAYSLAHMLRENGHVYAAAGAIMAWWESEPCNVDETLAAVTFLAECDAHVLGQKIMRVARARWPEDARVAAKAGEISLALGAFDEAVVSLREALDHVPNQSASWLRLAHCKRFASRDDADVRRLQRAWTEVSLSTDAKICAGFAFGKALDDMGDYASAANVLRKANALAREGSSWDSRLWRKRVYARLHSASLPRSSIDPDFAPIFIVGMPRSGTTLIASALSRYPGVRDRGELNWIRSLHAHLQEQRRLYDASALATVARLVRAQMQRDDARALFYIDKNPLNFLYLDFILALFPNAKIVHCKRGPRDTALSLWMQHFAHEDLSFSYDFSAIADVEYGCRQLMTHWSKSLELSIADLSYEAFVSHPEQQLHQLAEHLNLGSVSSEFCSTPLAAVTTASVWQVRQPVYTHAVARWRHYAPYVPELTERFEENA